MGGTDNRILFFTGTDTGVGKTHVVCSVARQLRAVGVPVGVCKPVASGADSVGDRLISEDTQRLSEAVGGTTQDEITRWTFAEPVAPPVAARRNGVSLSLGDIAGFIEERSEETPLLLVEGVGGLLCPLTEEHTIADLIGRLGCPTVAVARRSLGTLNHTLLMVDVARRRGLDLRGVIVSETEPPEGLADETNLDELARLLKSPAPDSEPMPILALARWQAAGPTGKSIADVDWYELARRG